MEQNKNNDMLLEVKDLRTYFHMPNGVVIKAVEGVNFTLKKGKVLGIGEAKGVDSFGGDELHAGDDDNTGRLAGNDRGTAVGAGIVVGDADHAQTTLRCGFHDCRRGHIIGSGGGKAGMDMKIVKHWDTSMGKRENLQRAESHKHIILHKVQKVNQFFNTDLLGLTK